MNAPADSNPTSGETKAREHYRKALEDTIQEDNFSADATRARMARFARREGGPSKHTLATMSGTQESVSARDPDFRPRLTRLQNPGKINDREKRYELGAVLGRGGSGQIFAARDLTLNRDVAIKVLYPDIATNPVRLERFINEARITAKLEHPYILPVYDLEVPENGDAYFSMRVANGLSLGEALRKASTEETPPFQIATIRDRITVFLKVLDALGFAHSKGVIHQDIKPDNIMLGNFGEVLVVDWGTAIAREAGSGGNERLIGTPAYMSPEQARRERADERSDVYGLCATFFQMLTLRHPTWESDPDAFWTKKREGIVDPPTPEERVRIPGPLLDLTLKGLAANPADRYQSVDELRAALQEYLQHAESITLQVSAQDSLNTAVETQDYAHFNQALFGFQEALKLWEHNSYAARGISETQLRYSECALAKGDLELAASSLNPADPHHAAALQSVAQVRARRGVVRRRVRQVQAAAGALVVVLIAFMGYYTIDYFRYFGQWKVVFNQDFTKPEADMNSLFISDTNNWEKEGPAPERGAQGLEIKPGTLGWLRDLRLHGDMRIEAQVRWPGGIDGFELFLNASKTMEGSQYLSPAGHICQFGGYSNTLNFIAPQEHCGTISRAGAVSYEFTSGQVYRLAFEREGEDLSIWVDGKLLRRHLQLLPVTRTGFDYLGFRTWAPVEILSLTVSRKTIPEKSSPLVAGDALYVDGHHEEALRVYRELSIDFAGKQIGEQALARAYLMTYANADIPKVVDIRAQLKKEMLDQYPKSAYWSEIFEADCVAAWRAKRFSDSLSLLPVIFQRDPDTRVILHLLEERHGELPPDVGQSILGWAAQTRNTYYLYLDNLGLRSLDPIASMKLTRIDVAGNALTTLQPLSGMPLKALGCASNQLKDLEPLRGMSLHQLTCQDNHISSLDPLRGMSQLWKLDFSDNVVTSLEPLHGLHLSSLIAQNNKLTALTPLVGVPLEHLRLSGNAIVDLSPLQGLPLNHLELDHNQIVSIEALRGMKLQFLHCGFNSIADIGALEGMPLYDFAAENNVIVNLAPLHASTVKVLNLNFNTVASIEPLRGLKLNALAIAGNAVSDLSPLQSQPIATLNLDSNPIASLEPLRGMPLGSLTAQNTKVEDISPLADSRISSLTLRGTNVSKVDVFSGKPPAVLVLDWEKVDEAEFERLMKKWAPALNTSDPKSIPRMRVARLVRTQQFDQLKAHAAEYRGHHYLVIPLRLKYEEAAAIAQKVGGHLATIADAEEQSFMATLMKPGEDVWLGLNLAQAANTWTNGEPLTFRADRGVRGKTGMGVLFMFGNEPAWIYYGPEIGLDVMSIIEWDN